MGRSIDSRLDHPLRHDDSHTHVLSIARFRCVIHPAAGSTGLVTACTDVELRANEHSQRPVVRHPAAVAPVLQTCRDFLSLAARRHLGALDSAFWHLLSRAIGPGSPLALAQVVHDNASRSFSVWHGLTRCRYV